jgi:hypothetical protein
VQDRLDQLFDSNNAPMLMFGATLDVVTQIDTWGFHVCLGSECIRGTHTPECVVHHCTFNISTACATCCIPYAAYSSAAILAACVRAQIQAMGLYDRRFFLVSIIVFADL